MIVVSLGRVRVTDRRYPLVNVVLIPHFLYRTSYTVLMLALLISLVVSFATPRFSHYSFRNITCCALVSGTFPRFQSVGRIVNELNSRDSITVNGAQTVERSQSFGVSFFKRVKSERAKQNENKYNLERFATGSYRDFTVIARLRISNRSYYGVGVKRFVNDVRNRTEHRMLEIRRILR